jgi:hypothetical protein
MSVSTTQALGVCEAKLYKADRKKPNTSAFDMSAASIYYLDDNGDAEFLSEHGDVYKLLKDENVLEALTAFIEPRFIIVTCGWASPLGNDDEDVRPSQHSQRRRVRLSLAVDDKNIISVIRFKDDKGNPQTETNGSGTLADQCRELYNQVITNKKAGK